MKRFLLLAILVLFGTTSCTKEYIISVDVSPNGSGQVVPDMGAFDEGTIVTLSAIPSDEYVFVRWSGDASGSNNPTDVLITSDKNVTAQFALKKYPLNIETIGEGRVNETIVSTGKGTEYDSGTTVRLDAIPSTGYYFAGWSGDIQGTNNPANITIGEPKSVVARFEKENNQISDSDTTSSTTEEITSNCSGSSSLINDSKLWLTFDNNLNDQSNYSNTVTNYGTSFSSDRKNINNSSLLLNGQNYLIVDENSSLETIELSVAVWVKPSSLGGAVPWNTILKKGTYSQASSETFWFALNDSQNGNGELQVGYKNNTCDGGQGWNKFIVTSNTPLINNWTHLVITHNSNNNQSIYINGSLFSSEVVEGNLSICPGGEISIGSEWSQNISGFIGSIDDLGLWDKVLSPCQVEWLYNN